MGKSLGTLLISKSFQRFAQAAWAGLFRDDDSFLRPAGALPQYAGFSNEGLKARKRNDPIA